MVIKQSQVLKKLERLASVVPHCDNDQIQVSDTGYFYISTAPIKKRDGYGFDELVGEIFFKGDFTVYKVRSENQDVSNDWMRQMEKRIKYYVR